MRVVEPVTKLIVYSSVYTPVVNPRHKANVLRPQPIFYAPLINTLEATTGVSPTYSRATGAVVTDYEGVIRSINTSEPRFQGARRVENLVDNSSLSSGTLLQNGAALVSSTETAPNGEPVAYSYSLPSTGTPRVLIYNPVTTSGDSYTDSVWLRSDVAGTMSLSEGSQNQYTQQVSVTTEWQRFSSPLGWVAITSVWFGVSRPIGGTLSKIYIAFPQRENVTGQTNQNPSEYVSTGVGTGPELFTPYATVTAPWVYNGGSSYSIDGSQSGAADLTLGVLPTVGLSYELILEASNVTGTTFMYFFNGSPNIYPIVNGTNKLYVSSAASYNIIRASAGATITIDSISIKQASHGANVDGVEYFKTLNANRVLNNVVTEAVGNRLTRANTQFGELMAAGDYFSTPNTTDNTIAGDVDVRAKIACNSYVGSDQTIVTKRTTSYRGEYTLRVSSSDFRNLQFYWGSSTTFVVFQQTMIANPLVDGTIAYVRATRGVNGANYEVKFYSSVDGVAWVQEGSTQTRPTAGNTPVSGNTPLAVGALNGVYENLVGRIYNVQVYNGINGTLAAEFNAGDYVSGSTLVSSTSGETWTLEGNASIFQPPVDDKNSFGYLAEKASTNLLTYSGAIGGTNWGNMGGGATGLNVIAAPDGTVTATKIVTLATTDSFGEYQNVTYAAATYTLSVWGKSGAYDYLCVNLRNDVSGAVFDLSDGSIGFTDSGITSTIESYPDGWYRCSVTGLMSAGIQHPEVYLSGSRTANVRSWTAVGTENLYVWGAQLEQNATYSTSYIPTTTTAVTRNADVLIAGDMVTDAAGSGYAEASSIWATAGGNHYPLATDGNGRILYVYSGTSSTLIRAYDGANVAFSPTGTSYQNRPAPMASTWGNNLTAYKDGVGGTAASYDGTMGIGNLGIGASNNLGSNQWNGTVREVKIFNSELTAAEVGDL